MYTGLVDLSKHLRYKHYCKNLISALSSGMDYVSYSEVSDLINSSITQVSYNKYNKGFEHFNFMLLSISTLLYI